MKFSFIHAADLHLDRPFQGVKTQSSHVAAVLRAATRQAFGNLIDLCLERRVDALLIAGDVFDSRDRNLAAQLFFRDGLEKLAVHGISTYIVHGNHDPGDGWSKVIRWPDAVHIFGSTMPTTQMLAVGGQPVASITGMSYKQQNITENLAGRFILPLANLFNIALLHTNCGGDPNHDPYAPCRLDELTASGFDYWALGHIHEKRLVSGPGTPSIVYPGALQGLNIKEQGPHGCFLNTVDCDQHTVATEFIELDEVRWLTASVDISEMNTLTQLEEHLFNIILELQQQADHRPVICRILLAGRTGLYHDLISENNLETLLERLREIALREDPFVWVQKITADCFPLVDLDKRAAADDLVGHILRIAAENQHDITGHGISANLVNALGELLQNGRARKFFDLPYEEALGELLRQAQLLCLDLLESEE